MRSMLDKLKGVLGAKTEVGGINKNNARVNSVLKEVDKIQAPKRKPLLSVMR